MAQISIAPLFAFYGASPNFIFAFFIASFLFLKNKKFIFISAVAAGIFAGFSSLLPAPAHIFAFSVLALILFLPEKLLADFAKKLFVLSAAFPLSFVYQIFLFIFLFADRKISLFFGAENFFIPPFENSFGRSALAEAFLNLIAAIIFYLILRLISKARFGKSF